MRFAGDVAHIRIFVRGRTILDIERLRFHNGRVVRSLLKRKVEMALIRWAPASKLQSVQSEMNRLFGTFFDSPTPRNGARTAAGQWIPAMDGVQTDDHFVLRADLPGLAEGDFNVELEDNVLTIS